jgi:hypothetical protein
MFKYNIGDLVLTKGVYIEDDTETTYYNAVPFDKAVWVEIMGELDMDTEDYYNISCWMDYRPTYRVAFITKHSRGILVTDEAYVAEEDILYECTKDKTREIDEKWEWMQEALDYTTVTIDNLTEDCDD